MAAKTFMEAFKEYGELELCTHFTHLPFDTKNTEIMFARYCEYILLLNRYHHMLIASLFRELERDKPVPLDSVEIPPDIIPIIETNIAYLIAEKQKLELEGRARAS